MKCILYPSNCWVLTKTLRSPKTKISLMSQLHIAFVTPAFFKKYTTFRRKFAQPGWHVHNHVWGNGWPKLGGVDCKTETPRKIDKGRWILTELQTLGEGCKISFVDVKGSNNPSRRGGRSIIISGCLETVQKAH